MTPLTYTYNEQQDIHIFKIHEASRKAVDAYAADMSIILAQLPEDAPCVRIILDFSDSALFPINYMQQQMKKVGEQHAPVPPAYVAYICDHAGDRSLIGTLAHSRGIRREDTRQTFGSMEFDSAVEWLTNKQG